MMHRLRRAALAALLLIALPTPDAAAQERFTTGPPPDAGRDRGRLQGPGSGPPPSPPDGDDIRANQNLNNLQNETSISVNPLDPDNWVGVANDYRTGTVQIGWYTTLDGGQTWTDGVFPLQPGYSFSGDPCVTFDTAGAVHVLGMQYFAAAGSAVWHYASGDGGLTWRDNRVAGPDISYDKPQVASCQAPGPRQGDITVAWNAFRTPDDVLVSTSTDGGVNWSASQVLNDNSSRSTIAPDVAYGPNGEVNVVWADRGSFDIWLDRSLDGGQTWGADILVTPYDAVPSPIPGSQFRIFDVFAVASDWTQGPYRGALYVAYHTWAKGSKQANVRCSTSLDGGATWSDVIVTQDPTQSDQVMPGIFVDPNGNANVAYYDRRLDPNNLLLWTWVSRSSDGGQSWVDHRVSDVGWDHTKTNSPFFIGDYLDCDGGAGFALPFWCDGRTRDLDVFTDVVDLDLYTDVDGISAATGGQVNFTLNAGPNRASDSYWLLGSLSTTGFTFPNGVHLPLDWDPFFLFTMKYANTPALQNTRGILDATGSAAPVLDSQGPIPPTLVGIDLYFAALLTSGKPTHATLPTKVTIQP